MHKRCTVAGPSQAARHFNEFFLYVYTTFKYRDITHHTQFFTLFLFLLLSTHQLLQFLHKNIIANPTSTPRDQQRPAGRQAALGPSKSGRHRCTPPAICKTSIKTTKSTSFRTLFRHEKTPKTVQRTAHQHLHSIPC